MIARHSSRLLRAYTHATVHAPCGYANEQRARYPGRIPANRLGKVEDIGPVIEFLASPRSQWITAQTIFVNGGYLAR